MLYNQSLQSGQLPQDWKCASIIPVFKKGEKSEATNYRPISLTSQIIKILESIVCDSIHKLLANHNLINPHQHGFVPRKSCLTNLLESFQDWIHSVDGGFGVDIVYLDYKKHLLVFPIVDYYISLKVMVHVYLVISCCG